MLFSRFLTCICLLGICHAVSLEEAFAKDWVRHYHSAFSKLDLTSDGQLIGITTANELVQVDLHEGYDMNWSFNLNNLPSSINSFKIFNHQNAIWATSEASGDVYLFDVSSGIIGYHYNLPTPVKEIEPFFRRGALALGENGSIYYLDRSSHTVELLLDETINHWHFSQVDGIVKIVADDSTLISINGEDKLVSTESLSVGAVEELKFGLLTTKNRVYQVQSKLTEVSLEKNVKNLQIVGENRLVGFKNNELSVLEVQGQKASVVYSSKLDNKIDSVVAFDDVILVHTISMSYVLDLYTQNILLSYPAIDRNPSFEKFAYRGNDLTLYAGQWDHQLVNVTLMSTFGGWKVGRTKEIYNFDIKNALLVDKPKSSTTIDKETEILDPLGQTFTVRWLRRVKRHLRDFGEYAVNIVNKLANEDVPQETEDQFGFQKWIVVVDTSRNTVVAFESLNGALAWSVDIPNVKLSDVKIDDTIHDIIFLTKDQIIKLDKQSRVITQERRDDIKDDNVFTVHNLEESVWATTKGKKLWTLDLGETIISLASKPKDGAVHSVGISLHDKSVLYKYLNPNTITVISKKEEALIVRILDGVTGSLLHILTNSGDPIDFDSVKLIMDDNWVIYSYFVTSEVEQRINVIDLFDSRKGVNTGKVSAFSYNSTIDSVSEKSFIFPERILLLSSTRTKYGITIKSIIAVTGSGSLMELPKYMLNSRRVDDRELTPDDFMDDFRMVPYEPVIAKNTFQVLNHKHVLGTNGTILTKPTNLESTAQVCYVSTSDMFCQFVEPSLSYDILGGSFDKVKLLLTIVGVGAVYIITKPMVYKRNLNSHWIDQ